MDMDAGDLPAAGYTEHTASGRIKKLQQLQEQEQQQEARTKQQEEQQQQEEEQRAMQPARLQELQELQEQVLVLKAGQEQLLRERDAVQAECDTMANR